MENGEKEVMVSLVILVSYSFVIMVKLLLMSFIDCVLLE